MAVELKIHEAEMKNGIMDAFSVQPSGTIGQVVLDPNGKIIAWTTDSWIAVGSALKAGQKRAPARATARMVVRAA